MRPPRDPPGCLPLFTLLATFYPSLVGAVIVLMGAPQLAATVIGVALLAGLLLGLLLDAPLEMALFLGFILAVLALGACALALLGAPAALAYAFAIVGIGNVLVSVARGFEAACAGPAPWEDDD